jgi:hypothetical protein
MNFDRSETPHALHMTMAAGRYREVHLLSAVDVAYVAVFRAAYTCIKRVHRRA